MRRWPSRRRRRDPDTPAARADACAGDAHAALERERARLARGAGLNRAHWAVLAASALLTLLAWQYARAVVAERAEDRFDRASERLLDTLVERFERYEDLLRAGAATVRSHGRSMPAERWRAFLEGVDLRERYPEIATLAVALPVAGDRVGRFVAGQRRHRPHFRIRPARAPGDRDEALVIAHVEPEASFRHVLGLDLLHEPVRATAAREARRTGEPRLTAPIELVRAGRDAPGLVFMMPVRGEGARAPAGAGAPRDGAAAMVVAPFALEELATGALDREWRHVGLRITDAGRTLVDELGPDDPTSDPDPLHEDVFEIGLYGRTWEVAIATDLAFRDDAGVGAPRAVLGAGAGIDTALFALFAGLSRGRRRALACADRAVDELHGKVVALAASNADLEGFAHIVSHDLKTPVRGIGGLVDFLAEDLEAHLGSLESVPDIARHLERLDEQHRRLVHLIDGVLAYSALGREHIAPETLDATGCVRRLGAELGLDDGRLRLLGEDAVFRTQAVRFEQVMRNLLENSVKHFEGDAADLRIEVRSDPVPGGWTFAVEDNGPGIEERYHEAVFEVFRRLRSKDEVEGSGVGLSIVKRSVEALGGSVGLVSAPGRGSRFELFWPAGDEADETGRPDVRAALATGGIVAA